MLLQFVQIKIILCINRKTNVFHMGAVRHYKGPPLQTAEFSLQLNFLVIYMVPLGSTLGPLLFLIYIRVCQLLDLY